MSWTLLAVLLAAAAPAPHCESLALFATTCARCHEAQCSGRMTFAGGPAQAREHVRRYGGPLSDELSDELVELLRATKVECRVPPGAAAACGTSGWDAERLRRTHVAAERTWFVPLGAPAPGPRRLELHFDRDTRAEVRISTAGFETLYESALPTRASGLEIRFDAPDAQALFLRVHVADDAQLVGVQVLAAAGR